MTNYKILIVDDVIDNLKIIVSIIEKHHPTYIIYQANDGQTALRALERIKPDIIITDWEMPVMNGIELTHILQNSPATVHIPVIMATGVMISPENLKTALEAGAMDYITKPIDATELLARMHSALTIAEKQKQLIREKESKIVENVVFNNEVNHLLLKVSSTIKTIQKKVANEQSIEKDLGQLSEEIQKRISENGWQKFNKDYEQLHPEYQKRLLELHPNLTPAELKLSAMIRLGLSTKELSALLFVSPDSMRVSRSRLRKKLGLKAEQNLQSYLSAI